MAESSYTVFNALVDIIASPGKALVEIKKHTAWLWTPLLITLLLAAGMLVYFYSWVDFPWLVEQTISQLPADQRAEAADAVRQIMQPGRSTMISVIAAVVVTFVIYLVQSVYLHLANKLVTGAEIRFSQWFSLSTWTGFVSIFGPLAVFVMLFLADSNQMSLESLQVWSLNSLLLHLAPGEPWYRWANSVNLVQIWVLVLLSIGYARWTGAAIFKSTIIAILPWVAIFGVWAALI